MTQINWLNIKDYNNSKNNAFEELVCQLAREEDIPDKKEPFIRLGTPDGGVECYWKLNNGKEYGWQAKYFFTLGSSQWNQIEESLKTTIDTHPNLIKYYICLPIDRPDPRIPNQKSLMDKWNEKVTNWKDYALSKGREIEFEFWGSSELLKKLSQPKNMGLKYFWFSQDEFTDQWFSEKLDRSIEALGNRYTPELNFELEIVKIFDGISKDADFKSQLVLHYGLSLKRLSKVISNLRDQEFKSYKETFSELLNNLITAYSNIDFSEMNQINYEEMIKLVDLIEEKIYICEDLIHELTKKEPNHKDDHDFSTSNKFSSELRYLNDLSNSLSDFKSFLSSETALLSNLPILILDGEAGIGKSHLLADIAKKRNEKKEPSLLLLGQHFVTDENPWTQILRNLLRLNCNEDELLGALNSKAQSIGSRIIIFIDAINEGRGRYFWKDNIKSFIKSILKYPWLGLTLSIRSSYKDLIVPKNILTDNLVVRLTHHGFAEVEYEASKLFFTNFKIQQPRIPLLHPEFQNPLFLKLFCEGLNKAGKTTIPEGYEGITSIINFYLSSINERLAEPTKLDYPSNINLVQKAINLIAQKLIETNKRYIEYEEAFILLENALQKFTSKGKILEALISEGILSRNLFWVNKESLEGVYIAYERFEDHLISSYLLNKYLDRSSPINSFSQGQRLFEYVKDERSCSINKGLIEAFSIQIPELIDQELYEIAPHCKSFYPVIESFVDSLVWRKTDTIKEKLIDYINTVVFKYSGTYDKFWENILLVTSNPNHFFNANFLHKHLFQFSLADRDAIWTIYIHKRINEQSSIHRLIDWAWSEENKDHISDDSILLTSKCLAWFLTSNNRYLRDSATKALICLFQENIPVLIQLLKEFEGVNDPYVYERLFAVAYGCSLRTDNKLNLKELSLYVYNTIFDQDYVYPHVLLRDYARGVIEYSLYVGIDLNIKPRKIRPPYKSVWPDSLPSNEEIESLTKELKDSHYGFHSIVSSMRTTFSGYSGDFGRYVFQRALHDWKDLNPQDISNLAVKRILELGYDVERHGKFDRNDYYDRYAYDGRKGRKYERIGKKYQWIAFYEILAKVADNFKMIDDSGWPEKKLVNYNGPWDPYVRDIDPSLLIKNTYIEQYESKTNHWWFNISYNDWDMPHTEWIKKTKDLPDPIQLITVKDSAGIEWYVLESSPEWDEPVQLGQEKHDIPYKNLIYEISSYFVKQSEYQEFLTRMGKQNFWDIEMPSSRESYQVFSREFYWSPAYKYFSKAYYNGESWKGIDHGSKRFKEKVIVTTDFFLWEEEYDYSKKEVIKFFKPCDILFNEMNLKFSKREGELLNQNNELVCFDPSVNYPSLSCLLIRKKDFLEFLLKNDLRICWTVLAEKRILGGDLHDKTGRLEISGLYYLDNDKLKGKVNNKLRSYPNN